MFCKYCGNELPDSANFCPLCGKVPTEEAAPDAQVDTVTNVETDEDYALRKELSSISIFALVFSIIGMTLCSINWLPYGLGVLPGFIFTLIAKSKIKAYKKISDIPSGRITAAKIISTIALILEILSIVGWVAIIVFYVCIYGLAFGAIGLASFAEML